MVTLTEKERRKWYPKAYEDTEKEAAERLRKEEELKKNPPTKTPPKEINLVLQNTYTCQDCKSEFKTWRDFEVVHEESPICDACTRRRLLGKINKTGWTY